MHQYHFFRDQAPTYGKLYYATGEQRSEGYYRPRKQTDSAYYPPKNEILRHELHGKGIFYYKNGAVYRQGDFEGGELRRGREYYPSGQLRFAGEFNSYDFDCWSGPSYPLEGRYYSEAGALLYEGVFIVRQADGASKGREIVTPPGYGPISRNINAASKQPADGFQSAAEWEEEHPTTPSGKHDEVYLGQLAGFLPPVFGRLYYDTGELRYVGQLITKKDDEDWLEPFGQGVEYRKNGQIWRQGLFQLGGLLQGQLHYQTGELKFDGRFHNRREDYIKSRPLPSCGKFHARDGSVLYEGTFKLGTRGFPGGLSVLHPEAYFQAEWDSPAPVSHPESRPR